MSKRSEGEVSAAYEAFNEYEETLNSRYSARFPGDELGGTAKKTEVPGDELGRLIGEKKELDCKLKDLINLVEGNTFDSLEKIKNRLLIRQAWIMRDYSDILGERIGLLREECCHGDR